MLSGVSRGEVHRQEWNRGGKEDDQEASVDLPRMPEDHPQNCREIRLQWHTNRQEKEIAGLRLAHRLRPVQAPQDGRTNKLNDIARQKQSVPAYEARDVKPKLKQQLTKCLMVRLAYYYPKHSDIVNILLKREEH